MKKFNFKYTGELSNDQNKEQIFLNKTQKNYKVEKTDTFYYLEFFFAKSNNNTVRELI